MNGTSTLNVLLDCTVEVSSVHAAPAHVYISLELGFKDPGNNTAVFSHPSCLGTEMKHAELYSFEIRVGSTRYTYRGAGCSGCREAT